MRATHCVLQAPPQGSFVYECRAAVAPCEGGIAQVDPKFEEDCNAREKLSPGSAARVGGGCSFRPPSCFCPTAKTKVAPAPGSPEERHTTSMSCRCAGGPTRQCLRGK